MSARVLASFLFVQLALIPTAGASTEGWVKLTSADPVSVHGEVRVSAIDASLMIDTDDATLTARLTGVTGRLDIWEADYVVMDVGERVIIPQGAIRRETYDLQDTTLQLEAVAEEVHVGLQTLSGGTLTTVGHIDAAGEVGRLGLPFREHEGTDAPESENPSLSWQTGWSFVGKHAAVPYLGGFPVEESSVVDINGPVLLKIFGGDVVFTDAHGQGTRVDLGKSIEPASIGVRRETWRRLTFEGSVASSEIPTGSHWGMAGPQLDWFVNGSAEWTNATGKVGDGRSTESFTTARVRIEGAAFRVTNSPDASLVAAATSFYGTGDISRVNIDGARVPSFEDASDGTIIAAVSIAVLLANALAFAPRFAAAFYSRIHRGDLLDHPARQRIVEHVSLSPGIHVRALARGVGGAWGPFNFHFRLLCSGGYLTVSGTGRYRMVFVVGSRRNASELPVIPHPVARALFEALPEGGGIKPIEDLRLILGVSRQLVSYHLLRLDRAGHVTILYERRRMRGAARRVTAGSVADLQLGTDDPLRISENAVVT